MTDWLGVIGIILGLAASNVSLYFYMHKKRIQVNTPPPLHDAGTLWVFAQGEAFTIYGHPSAQPSQQRDFAPPIGGEVKSQIGVESWRFHFPLVPVAEAPEHVRAAIQELRQVQEPECSVVPLATKRGIKLK